MFIEKFSDCLPKLIKNNVHANNSLYMVAIFNNLYGY